MMSNKNQYVIALEKVRLTDLPLVGGKNASLGEMLYHLSDLGVTVPSGFATTAQAYWDFLSFNQLDHLIFETLKDLSEEDLPALQKAGLSIREHILKAAFPKKLEEEIVSAYEAVTEIFSKQSSDFSFAVRSSATAEDLPEASFAGQQETFLNVSGIENILEAIKKVYASLFTDRAIAYRQHHHFSHKEVAISVGVQQMVRSDCGASGVAFSLDTESGFSEVILVTAAYGLGELVVQGAVNPDEMYLYKPNIQSNKPSVLRKHLGSKMQKMIYSEKKEERVCVVPVSQEMQRKFALTDDDLMILGKQVFLIEQHYRCPVDVEWAKDGITGKLYILQARPETVMSQKKSVMTRYELQELGQVLVTGRSIGQRIGQGPARVVKQLSDMHLVQTGEVLVADMTDPDWEPVMKKASAIVTNRGGRTCHAAIIARELGIPAVVGTSEGTHRIPDGSMVTVSCAEGEEGKVYQGKLRFKQIETALNTLPELHVKLMLNVANPERAFAFSALPNQGVGLARLEFIISSMIGIHPSAILNLATLPESIQKQVLEKTSAYDTPRDFYVRKLVEGISTIAAAFFPKPVIVRLSDFKSNEYRNLLGGAFFEPEEENPMIGFRGACRYVHPQFKASFALECEAIRIVRESMGLNNVEVMIPFVRTLNEAQAVIQVLKSQGLERQKAGLRLIMMCEVPSNALLAEAFLEYFDGFSIGSNDLTQLTLGVDRDSAEVASAFDERDPAVRFLLERAIDACKKLKKYIGICGQGPSDHPDLASFLYEKQIDSLSLNPDTVLQTALYLEKEKSV